jgi:ribosome biogenesis protein BMS1
MSDIVFLRCWYPIKPKIYCNQVTNLLLNSGEKWRGMRTIREIRRGEQIELPTKPDSIYRAIVDRPEERKFNPLKIPSSLLKQLPYASRPKIEKKRSAPTYLQKRAVIMESKEREIYKLFQKLNTIKNLKDKHQIEYSKKKKEERARKLGKQMEVRTSKSKQEKKEMYRELAKKEAAEKRKIYMGESAFNVKKSKVY